MKEAFESVKKELRVSGFQTALLQVSDIMSAAVTKLQTTRMSDTELMHYLVEKLKELNYKGND